MASSRDKLLQQFRDLVGERLGRITKSVMELEAGPNQEAGKNALRELHGLKGEARMMGFADINTVTHEMEEVVRSAAVRGYALSGGSIDALLASADAVMVLSGAVAGVGAPPEIPKLVDWLKQRVSVEGAASPAPSGPAAVGAVAGAAAASSPTAIAVPPAPVPPTPVEAAAPPPSAPRRREGEAPAVSSSAAVRGGDLRLDSSVRISQQSLDLLTSAVTNLGLTFRRRGLASRNRLMLARELALLARAAEDLGPKATALATRLVKAKEVAAALHREEKLLANEEVRDLTRVTEEVQELRMLPLSVMFEPYPRMVRDLSRELSKEVELTIEGENTRVDRSVLEALKDPMMHLVRNALDHGIEPSGERQAAGKGPKGKLFLRAMRDGDSLRLTVRDDGRGLDPAHLRLVAVKKGLMDEQAAQALSDRAAIDLIFVSGFSSKDSVTDISGRGVGLDAVRSRLQELGGEVDVRTEVGAGAAFELRVPISLTMAPLLFVQVGEERLCLTAAQISSALKVEKDQCRELAGRPAVKVGDEVVPFASISSILGLAPPRKANEGELVLLVRGQGAKAAISVDRVLEERVQAVIPLKGLLSSFKHLAGATPMADGSLAMVLSAAHLIATARGAAPLRLSASERGAAETKKRRILVVDDSPLTRELLCSLLEATGHEVLTASDGVEGLERLGKEPVDMVVSDLEMPRMDGLEFTRRVKSHPTLRSLPVVIVTTRGGDADRRRGMEAGADGYIAKGDLVRQDLVDVVSRLLG